MSDESVTPCPVERELMYELRTPLTVLLGRMQLLRLRHAQGREPLARGEELEAMEAAILRLIAAVDRLDGRS